MVLVSGGIDLSVGSLLALCNVLMGLSMLQLSSQNAFFQLTLGIGMALFTGAVVGFFNGYIAVHWQIPPFIVTLGMLGVAEFAAIIYPPQTAILAISAVKDTPVVREGSVTSTKLMHVTLSVDHRVVDGITAANFLRDLKKYLETEDLEVIEKPCCTVEDE